MVSRAFVKLFYQKKWYKNASNSFLTTHNIIYLCHRSGVSYSTNSQEVFDLEEFLYKRCHLWGIAESPD